MKHVRNFGIVLALALGVYFIPGGGTAAQVIQAVLFITITVGVGLLAAKLYVENRSEIYGLGDRWRLVLYAAVGVLVLLLAGTSKMWDSGPGTVLWLALFAGVIYAFFAVVRQSRQY